MGYEGGSKCVLLARFMDIIEVMDAVLRSAPPIGLCAASF